MADFSLDVKDEGDVVIIETTGYLNNVGGEKISEACYEKMENGKKLFLLDLENSKVVNSIGVSILIEIIEKLQDVDGKLGYYEGIARMGVRHECDVMSYPYKVSL